jgi:hypothetical protein
MFICSIPKLFKSTSVKSAVLKLNDQCVVKLLDILDPRQHFLDDGWCLELSLCNLQSEFALSGVTECENGGWSARVVHEHVFVKHIYALPRDLIGKQNLQDLLALIVSRDGNRSVRFNLSHFVKHYCHLLNLVYSELCCHLGVKNFVRALEESLHCFLF